MAHLQSRACKYRILLNGQGGPTWTRLEIRSTNKCSSSKCVFSYFKNYLSGDYSNFSFRWVVLSITLPSCRLSQYCWRSPLFTAIFLFKLLSTLFHRTVNARHITVRTVSTFVPSQYGTIRSYDLRCVSRIIYSVSCEILEVNLHSYHHKVVHSSLRDPQKFTQLRIQSSSIFTSYPLWIYPKDSGTPPNPSFPLRRNILS